MSTQALMVKISIYKDIEKKLNESEMTKFNHFCTGLDVRPKELFYLIKKIQIEDTIGLTPITTKDGIKTTIQSFIEENFKFIPKKTFEELREINFTDFYCTLHKPILIKVQLLEKKQKNLISKLFHS